MLQSHLESTLRNLNLRVCTVGRHWRFLEGGGKPDLIIKGYSGTSVEDGLEGCQAEVEDHLA